MLPSVPALEVMSLPALTRQVSRPVAASRRARAPSALTTYRLLPDKAGVKAYTPDLPMEYFHASRTARLDFNSTNGAGSTFGSFLANGFKDEQPATRTNRLAATSFSVTRISVIQPSSCTCKGRAAGITPRS